MKYVVLVVATLLALAVVAHEIRPRSVSSEPVAAKSTCTELDVQMNLPAASCGDANTQLEIRTDRLNGKDMESSTSDLVASVQRALIELGYAPGPVDGVLGIQTHRAIRWYQMANALTVDGDASIALIQHLNSREQAGALRTNTEILAIEPLQASIPYSGPVLVVQRALSTLGYMQGPIDGHSGVRTRAAILAYQREFQLQADGAISVALMKHLRAQLTVEPEMYTTFYRS